MPSLNQMDLDAYTAAHGDRWNRLGELGAQRHFTGAEADELIDEYQSGATQLSAISTTVGSSLQGDRLSLALSRARLRFTGASSNVLSQRAAVLRAPAAGGALPGAAGCRSRSRSATIVVSALYAWWAISNPEVLATHAHGRGALGSCAEEDFVAYYSEYSGTSFTTLVWTNNAYIAGLCIATGITGFPLYLLLSNAAEPRAHVRDHGRVRPDRHLLPLHRTARPARAVRDLRGRRDGTAIVLGLDRAGRPHAWPRPSPRTAARCSRS